jgi:hypothetical protein
MGAVNARAFGLPGVRRTAMGYQAPRPIGYGPDATKRTGGVRTPRAVKLAPGTTIVRFGQKRLTEASVATDEFGQKHQKGTTLSHRGLIGGALEGAWWLELSEFRKVARYADSKSIPISAAVSALCVIPAKWSDLDVMVSAKLTAPLLAYRGRPQPADHNGTHVPVMRDLDGDDIIQLFIPGLGNGDVVRQALMHSPPTFLHQGWS